MTKEYAIFQSDLGELYIVTEGGSISSVYIGIDDFLKREKAEQVIQSDLNPILIESIKQFEEYFSGKREIFDIPIKVNGTEFQRSVWEQLTKIPYGQTRSYQDVATGIGNSKAVRAIGQANKANRLPIIIPCHRVIGKNLSLTGYAGTRTDIKEKLLKLEGALFK